MPHNTMTPRERWQAVLTGVSPDRTPMDYWGTPEATANLVKHLGCSTREEAFDKLHIDYGVVLEPRYTGPALPTDTDAFGCKYQDIDYGSGVYTEVVDYPLKDFNSVEEIEEKYTWPDPDWWDYSDIPAQAVGNKARPLIIEAGPGFYRVYRELRGPEQGMTDLLLNPDMVHYCLDKIIGLIYERLRRTYEQIPGQVLISFLAQDMGGQDRMLLSPKHAVEFLIPRIKRIADLAHEADTYLFFHSDGSIRPVIPALVEAGVDILNPIQYYTKDMEREGLKRDFGDQLVFHGAVDSQNVLPFGTAEQVRQEVLDNLRILGKGGGYIMASCHFIQPDVPPENVVTMYETGYAEG